MATIRKGSTVTLKAQGVRGKVTKAGKDAYVVDTGTTQSTVRGKDIEAVKPPKKPAKGQ